MQCRHMGGAADRWDSSIGSPEACRQSGYTAGPSAPDTNLPETRRYQSPWPCESLRKMLLSPARLRSLVTAECAATPPEHRAVDHRLEIRKQPDLHFSASRWIACSSNRSCAETACRYRRNARER